MKKPITTMWTVRVIIPFLADKESWQAGGLFSQLIQE